ncbi:MAG: NAD-binding protein [Desulfobaccales bacterium]
MWRRELRPLWEHYRWAIIGGLFSLTLFLVLIYGILRYFKIFDHLDLSLSLCQTAIKVLGATITAYATFKAATAIFHQQIQAIRLSLSHNHVVVCGNGKKASFFTRAFYEDGYKVVLVSNDKDTNKLEQFRDLNILIVIGDPTDREILQKARVQKAQYLVAVCENDGDNAEIAVNARSLVSDFPHRILTCLVHITNPHLCTLLKEREIMAQKGDSFRMEFLNVFESGARQLLKEFPGFGEGVGSLRPHLLIVGLGPMGKSLAVHAGMLWRMQSDKTRPKLPITLVDKNADQKKEFLELNFHQLNDSWDLMPVALKIDSPQFYQAKFLQDEQGHCNITMVYVCLEDDSRSLSAALALFQHLRYEDVPIVVQMDCNAGLATLLHDDGDGGGSFCNLHSFGLLDHKCKTDWLLYSTHEILARAIHQDYVLRQKNLGMTRETNPSLVPWDKLPEHIKISNRRQADDIGKKLKKVQCEAKPLTDWDAELFQFTPEEIEVLARMEHERWLKERRNEGWTHDPGTKDLERKKSPYLIEWDELPEDLKQHNRDAMRSLPVFMAGVGFQIFRNLPKKPRNQNVVGTS